MNWGSVIKKIWKMDTSRVYHTVFLTKLLVPYTNMQAIMLNRSHEDLKYPNAFAKLFRSASFPQPH